MRVHRRNFGGVKIILAENTSFVPEKFFKFSRFKFYFLRFQPRIYSKIEPNETKIKIFLFPKVCPNSSAEIARKVFILPQSTTGDICSI